jgi:hypothetical protein
MYYQHNPLVLEFFTVIFCTELVLVLICFPYNPIVVKIYCAYSQELVLYLIQCPPCHFSKVTEFNKV